MTHFSNSVELVATRQVKERLDVYMNTAILSYTLLGFYSFVFGVAKIMLLKLFISTIYRLFNHTFPQIISSG